MKVLLAHDFYRSSAPSGEDAAYRNERSMLEKAGVGVVPFERHNDAIDDSTLSRRVSLALNGAWSRKSYDDISALVRRTKPDVAHFHNTFPLISPSGYAACRDNGVPVVQTLHNFRFICPGALLLRGGKPCEACVGATLLPALLHRCYRNSAAATAAQVWTLVRNRRLGVYSGQVDRYVALTRFAASRLAAGGLPAERIDVKPNFLPDDPGPGAGDGGYAAFVGRLSEEKGVRVLLSAWRSVCGFPLKIAGDGPLRPELERQAVQEGLAVEFLGYRRKDEVNALLRNAVLSILPSICYEGVPMSMIESFACGTPVLASRIGSLAELVEEDTGVTFEAGNPDDLAAIVAGLRKDPGRLAGLRATTRNTFESRYTEKKNLQALLGIYRKVVDA